MRIISASIDLTKIDKSKINNHANGAKYYPISIIIKDEKDNYGNDVAITTGQSKEERERKDKQVYIGNGKTVFYKQSDAAAAKAAQVISEENKKSDSTNNSKTLIDDLPF